MESETPIVIGNRESWGNTVPFGLSSADARLHLYIIGKTGSGKSTLLRNLLIQHIALGHGVGLIDPHGDLAEDILNHIPPSRADNLVYFNPADREFPIAMNLLANVPADERHLVASGIVGACKAIWHDSWGPRLEYILYNAIAALLECENTSLLGVNRLLTDEAYRAWVVRQIEDPFLRDFWTNEYASYDVRFQREAIAPIQNKLGQFLLNPIIVLMHNHPSGEPTPSEADIKITRDLIRAGQLLKMDVLDHVIMGNPNRSSLRELGYFYS